MAKDGGLYDPLRQRLVAELRVLRRGQGAWAVRVAPLVWLVDAAGLGLVERAVARLEQLRQELGTDPLSDVGAFFWLGDVGITEPEVSLEQRLARYAEVFHCNERTALRRSDRGIAMLAAALRDEAERRPFALIWLFQSAGSATVVLDCVMEAQSVREPVVSVNGEAAQLPPFVGHREPGVDGQPQYRARAVLDDLPVQTAPGPYLPCLAVRVLWDMPVWPVWQLTGWVVDPHYLVRLQTFRQRAAEVSLVWRDDTSSVREVVPRLHEGEEAHGGMEDNHTVEP